jgi:hypothetical protein
LGGIPTQRTQNLSPDMNRDGERYALDRSLRQRLQRFSRQLVKKYRQIEIKSFKTTTLCVLLT